MDDIYLRTGSVTQFEHTHPSIKNVDAEFEKNRTPAQILADMVAATVGSWAFIAIQSVLLVIWIGVNVVLVMKHSDKAWDPYPFILLNLALSFQSAYAGPIVMMSQNRQAEKDRRQANSDYETNIKAEAEIRVIMEHLTYQDKMIRELVNEVKMLRATQQHGGVAIHTNHDHQL
ncbi:MAG: hypothetical protein RL169_2003 [Armatimonadota bacterium]